MTCWLRSRSLPNWPAPGGFSRWDRFADREQRALVTKDADFVDSHLLHARPAKLLLISTGNIGNRDLQALVVPVVQDIVGEFQAHSFLELGRTGIVIRG